MRNLYARFVLWLIRPALERCKEQADKSKPKPSFRMGLF